MIVLYLDSDPSDGDRPRRSRYWLSTEPLPTGWRVQVSSETWESWRNQAVPADCPDGTKGCDKASWRLSNRFALVRTRDGWLGVDAQLLTDATFQPLEES